MAKKRSGHGRATPKGTVDPTRVTRSPDRPRTERAGAPPHELAGKAGRPSPKAARPITHHRGNR